MLVSLAVCGLAVVVVSLLGGLLPLASELTHTRLQLYLSFAAGTMLGAAFFHMMPEAVATGSAGTLRWAAAGLAALFLLERFFSFHQHEAPGGPQEGHGHEHGHSHAHRNDHSHDHAHTPRARVEAPTLNWAAAAVGLAVHSLIGGVALASAVVADFATRGGFGAASWGVLLATIVHKPADSLTVVSLMLRARAPQGLAHLVNFGFALMIPAGVALFLVGVTLLGATGSGAVTASALAFSAGTFLCVALSDLLPELHFHSHDRTKLSIAFLAGLALMFVSSLGEGEHAHGHADAPAHAADHPGLDRTH